MHSNLLEFREGPAQDITIYFNGTELFATPQITYLHQSPTTLLDTMSSIILDASYWWFDSGRTPEILKIERDADMVNLMGGRRFEQIPGDSQIILGSLPFSEWLSAIHSLPRRN
jgi:hypothetical protein